MDIGFKELSLNDCENTNGGLVAGAIVGGIFGLAAGCATSCGEIVATHKTDLNEVYKNCITGTSAGAALGACTPF